MKYPPVENAAVAKVDQKRAVSDCCRLALSHLGFLTGWISYTTNQIAKWCSPDNTRPILDMRLRSNNEQQLVANLWSQDSYARSSTTLPWSFPSSISWNLPVSLSMGSTRYSTFTMPLRTKSNDSMASFLFPTALRIWPREGLLKISRQCSERGRRAEKLEWRSPAGPVREFYAVQCTMKDRVTGHFAHDGKMSHICARKSLDIGLTKTSLLWYKEFVPVYLCFLIYLTSLHVVFTFPHDITTTSNVWTVSTPLCPKSKIYTQFEVAKWL